jgi:sec-independent protein translocase protein TatA
MGNLGMTEIVVILLIVLLLFGAKRIPEVAGSIGKGINEFKRNMSDAQRAITEPVRDDPPRSIGGASEVPRSSTTTAAAPAIAEDEVAARQPKRLLG